MMKRQHLLITAFFALVLLQSKPVTAQAASFDSLLSKALETDELLPYLLDSAIKYSPSLKLRQSNIELLNENLKISKNLIFSGVTAGSSFNYGTNYSAISSQNGASLTNSQSGFYNVGIGIQLPLSQLLNRKHILKVGKNQVEMAKSEKEVTIYDIKQAVIIMYHQFKLAHKIVAVAIKNNQSTRINYGMMEKDFILGQVTVAQIAAVSEIANKSAMEFETAVNNFQSQYMQLELLTNTNLLTLIKLVK